MADDFEKDWSALRPSVVRDMGRDELRQFVLALCDGKVFTSQHIPADRQKRMLPLVFLPLFFGGVDYLPERDHDKIGLFWEYRDQALPRSIDGYPCFMSCRVMTRSDWERAHEAYTREMDRRAKLVLFDGDDDDDT